MFNSPNATITTKKKSPAVKKVINITKENSNEKMIYMKPDTFQRQQILKKMLKEYGLQQYLRVFIDSSIVKYVGDIHAIIKVLVFPPKLSFNNLVSLLSL